MDGAQVHHGWNTGPILSIIFSLSLYIKNPDCLLPFLPNPDQPHLNQLGYRSNSRVSMHSRYLRRQHDLSTNLLPLKRLNQDYKG
jgi:hypothetical protein